MVYFFFFDIYVYFGGFVDMVIFSFYLVGVFFILGVINFIIMIFNMWVFGVFFNRMFLFVWFILIIVFLLFLFLFVLVGVIIMLLIDWNFNIIFFDFFGGGDFILF